MAQASPTQLVIASPTNLELLGLVQLASRIPGLRVCATANSAGQAMRSIQQHRPDMVVLDVRYIDVPYRARDRLTTRFLLLVNPCDLRNLSCTWEGRVCGALDRTASLDVIKDAMEHIAHCNRPKSERYACEACPLQKTMRQDQPSQLSKREMQIFLMIGRGLGKSVIARELNLSVKTVETHGENIKRKLNLANASEVSWAARRWHQGVVARESSECTCLGEEQAAMPEVEHRREMRVGARPSAADA